LALCSPYSPIQRLREKHNRSEHAQASSSMQKQQQRAEIHNRQTQAQAEHHTHWLQQQMDETELIRQHLQQHQYHHPDNYASQSNPSGPQGYQYNDQAQQQVQRRSSNAPHFMLPTESAYIHAHSVAHSDMQHHQHMQAHMQDDGHMFLEQLQARPHIDTQSMGQPAQKRYSFAHNTDPLDPKFIEDVAHHSLNHDLSQSDSHVHRRLSHSHGSDTHSDARSDTHSSLYGNQTQKPVRRASSMSANPNLPSFMQQTESYYVRAHSNPLVPASPMHIDKFKQRRKSSLIETQFTQQSQPQQSRHFFPDTDAETYAGSTDHSQYSPDKYGQQQYQTQQQQSRQQPLPSQPVYADVNKNPVSTAYPQSHNMRSQYW
jgi:hypothetical protein